MPLLSFAEVDAHRTSGSGCRQGQCRVPRHHGTCLGEYRCVRPFRRTGGRHDACGVSRKLSPARQNYQGIATAPGPLDEPAHSRRPECYPGDEYSLVRIRKGCHCCSTVRKTASLLGHFIAGLSAVVALNLLGERLPECPGQRQAVHQRADVAPFQADLFKHRKILPLLRGRLAVRTGPGTPYKSRSTAFLFFSSALHGCKAGAKLLRTTSPRCRSWAIWFGSWFEL